MTATREHRERATRHGKPRTGILNRFVRQSQSSWTKREQSSYDGNPRAQGRSHDSVKYTCWTAFCAPIAKALGQNGAVVV